MEKGLSRYIEAQEGQYAQALSEIKSGRKKSHWMWYIFPQIAGLGFSSTSKYYAIESLSEAEDYLNHPILGKRLREITGELLLLMETNAHKIMGSPDDLKLKSSMTLFSLIDDSEERLFERMLKKFFSGEPDQKTLHLLKK